MHFWSPNQVLQHRMMLAEKLTPATRFSISWSTDRLLYIGFMTPVFCRYSSSLSSQSYGRWGTLRRNIMVMMANTTPQQISQCRCRFCNLLINAQWKISSVPVCAFIWSDVDRLVLSSLQTDLNPDPGSLPFILQRLDRDGSILKGPPGYQVY